MHESTKTDPELMFFPSFDDFHRSGMLDTTVRLSAKPYVVQTWDFENHNYHQPIYIQVTHFKGL